MNEDKNNFLFSLRFRWTRKNYEKFYCLIWKKGKVIPIGYLKIYKCKIYIYIRNNIKACPWKICEQFLEKYGS